MIEEEYGGSQGWGFAKVIAYDSENKEIVCPICEKCGWHKSMVIGKECFKWICTNLSCGKWLEKETTFVYRPPK